MDKLQIFRGSMNPDIILLPLHPGPPELGGPRQQRLTVHFKLGSYEEWVPKAMESLARMATYSFPSGIRFYRLPGTIIEDHEICIREFHMPMPEEWTEPAEDLIGEQRRAFVRRKKWDAHTRVTFETIFQFGETPG